MLIEQVVMLFYSNQDFLIMLIGQVEMLFYSNQDFQSPLYSYLYYLIYSLVDFHLLNLSVLYLLYFLLIYLMVDVLRIVLMPDYLHQLFAKFQWLGLFLMLVHILLIYLFMKYCRLYSLRHRIFKSNC